MVINLDYQPAVAQRAGIGRYTRLLAHYLPDYLAGDDCLRLFYFDFTRHAEAPDNKRAEACPWRLAPGKIIQKFWQKGLPPNYNWLAGKADLYHFTNFIIPPISPKAKTVATIFDMSFMRHPECAEAKNLAYMTSRIGNTVERADAIITISKFSADETVEYFPKAKGKVFPIYLGLDQTLVPPSTEQIAIVRKKYSLERPYIISVGTLEPRKNYTFLVDAFERMSEDVDLVIVGHPGWNYEPILEKFTNSSKAKKIHCLTGLGDNELAALYSGAELFALASLYEGFGFPPLEAMQCGTPVVSSNGGSLAEVLGDAAEIVDEFNADRWAAALDRMLTDQERRTECRNKGFERAKAYRWADTARETYDVYLKTLGL